MAAYAPAFLPIGTEVSAKYRGAFCEAKVKKIVKLVKVRVTGKESPSSVWITDEHVVAGVMKVGSVVQFKQPDSGQVMEGVVNKVNDNSTYTVVFNDGDERTLRRNQLCLKGDKHFDVSETLDNLPLSNPEHFGTPVLKSKKAVRSRTGDSDLENEDSSSDEESQKRASYKSCHQELVGKVMVAEVADKRKGAPTPVLVVLPDAHPVELKNRDQLLVRSFRDTKFMAVNRKDLKDFSRESAKKNEDKGVKIAFEKALLYFDGNELPMNWNREELLGPDEEEEEESSDDEEQCEERDRFVAQLYKFMDDRGTPINKGPCIGNKDLNLYRLFRVVQNIGGYNKATNQMKWRLVYSKMGLPPSNTAAHQIKNAYKKYLHAFEDFYRKLGSIMGTISRPGRQSRQTPSRGILAFRARERESSPRSPRMEKAAAAKEAKEDKAKEEEKAKAKAEKPAEEPSASQETADASEATSLEETDSDVVRRSTPRREKAQKEEPKSDKKEDVKVRKEEEKKEEALKEEKKKEEKREERKSLRQSQKEKEDDKKDVVKAKEEEKKEVKKEDGKTDRVLRKDLNDKEEEEKKEPEESKEAQKKRVSRRKSARVEEDNKKEGDDKEEDEEKGEEKKKEKKAPASAKKEKIPAKKKAEEEENESKDKESENESEEEAPSTSAQGQEVLSLGTRLKVRYGRGRNHKIYEAKVIEHRTTDPHKKYRVHYAGWNTRYDEWVETERIVKVVDKPELSKLKKKPLAAKTLKTTTTTTPPPPAAKPETPPPIKKRGRQSSTQQVPSPGGSTSTSTKPPPPPPTPTPAEPKTPKNKATVASSASAASKTRSMRSSSTEIKPETPPTSAAKHRITRRSSGVNETSDEPVSGDMEGGSESDMEVESAPGGPAEADSSITEPMEVEEPKEQALDTSTEDKEEIQPPVEPAVEVKPTTVPQEEDSASTKVDDSKSKQLDTESESVSQAVSAADTDSSKETEPTLPPPSSPTPPSPQPPPVPEESVVSLKDSGETVPDTPKQPEEVEEPVQAAATEEVKEAQKTEESAPQLVSMKEEATVKEEAKADEEKNVQASCIEASPVGKQEAEKVPPLHDPTIPQLKKIELDLPPTDDKKDGKEKDRMKPGKKLGRDFKKGRQSEMRTSFSEIPTLEPMTTPSEVKPAPVDVTPSPYDFNDTEADSPSLWQPEITKKWDPTNRPLPLFRDVKMELKKSLETEKKKVKKKTKKAAEEQGGEGGGESPVKASEKKAKDPSLVKKGRKKKVTDSEVKVDTSSYEETVNSVVESCKNDDLSRLPLPPSLVEPKEEKPPAKKRKKMLQGNAAQEAEAATPEGKKEATKGVKALKGKVGRKKKEAKLPDTVTEQPADSVPTGLPPPHVHIPSQVSHHENQPSAETCEPVPVKQPCLESEVPSVSLLGSCSQGLVPPAPKAGPSGLQVLSMASIRPVPSTSGAAGNGPSERLAPLLEGVHCGEVVKQPGLEPRVDCAGDMPKAACSAGNTLLDNTPPTTPENDLDEANSGSSSSEGHDNLKEDLDSLDSVERTCKGGSESPPGCDFSLSSTSSENLPSSSSGAQSNSQPSQSLETVGTKRKRKEDTTAAPAKKKKRLVSRSTRAERNKKSPKYGDDDSQSHSPLHQNNTDSGLLSGHGHGDATKSSTPRPPKFHFADDLGEHLQGEPRIQFLLEKMKEIRKVYQGIKAEVAAIDRKRKRARRKEKERESSQTSTGDREAS